MIRRFAVVGCSVVLASQIMASSHVGAQESFRVTRPSSSNLVSPVSQAFRNAMSAWSAQNSRPQLNTTPHPQIATAGSASPMPVRPPGYERIYVTESGCPAQVDPAFNFPQLWWAKLDEEERDPVVGPEWKLWNSTVEETFRARAHELATTPGFGALHVIVDSEGTIIDASPYRGGETNHICEPRSEALMMHLKDMVVNMGSFPPFPGGSRLEQFHVLIDAIVVI